jgi:hypothetical protein
MPPILEIGPENAGKRLTDQRLEALCGRAGSASPACIGGPARAAGPVWSAPALERRAEEHARWEVRLFAS